MLGGVWALSGPEPGHHLGINRKLFGDTRCIAAIGKNLHAEQEPDNAVNEFAMKVVKNNETVSHLPQEYSAILWYFIACGGKTQEVK